VKGDYDSALADFNKAIELNPDNAENYRNRGTAYFFKGEFFFALTDLNEAIRLDPKNPAAYFIRGSTYKALGQINDANKDFEKVLEISTDPDLVKSAEEELEQLKGQ